MALAAGSRDTVDAFYRAALTEGGRSHLPPAERPEYRRGDYAAVVLDPDGNKVEAIFHGG